MVRLGDGDLENRSRVSYAARATANIMLKNETIDIKGGHCSIHLVRPHGTWDITTGPTVSPGLSTSTVSGIPALSQDLAGILVAADDPKRGFSTPLALSSGSREDAADWLSLCCMCMCICPVCKGNWKSGWPASMTFTVENDLCLWPTDIDMFMLGSFLKKKSKLDYTHLQLDSSGLLCHCANYCPEHRILACAGKEALAGSHSSQFQPVIIRRKSLRVGLG